MKKNNSLFTLADQYKTKLGLTSSSKEKTSLPGKLQKMAAKEVKLQEKFAKYREEFSKVASGPTVKVGSERVPARYEICSECQGLGKVATAHNPSIKFSSAQSYLEACQVLSCNTCKGERVIKICAGTDDQIEAYAQEVEEKKQNKKDKKKAKALAKAQKAEAKLNEHKLALQDPESYAALKAEKKAHKSKKKAIKKLKKSEVKALKAKAKLAKLV